MKEPKKFCERSLKLWLGMFVALVCVVLLWAILFEDDSRPKNRKLIDWSVIGRKRFRAIDGITHATPKGGVKFIAHKQSARRGGQAPSWKSSESIYELVSPATVAISAISLPAGGWRAPGQDRRGGQGGQAFVEPFDGIPDKRIGETVYENVGSGVIIDERGYIVTNHHVVENASTIVVTLFGRLKGHYPAQIVASDRKTELALLKLLVGGSYPYLRLGDSSLVEPGEEVFAMGSPFGFSQSMAKGIISSKKRSMDIQGIDLGKMFQIDAHINKGSSGGPLVNRSGEVIGINTAIYAPGGVPSGIGFAIPSNRTKKFLSRFPKVFGQDRFAPAALRKGIADQSRFGVEVLPVDRVIARIFDLPKACGVVVNKVLMGSPAQRSGIRRGDVITRIGAEVVRDTDSLFKIGKETAWEKGTKITVYRDGKALLLDIK